MNADNCLDEFLAGYIACALWSSMDNSDPDTGGHPLDSNYDESDIEPDTLASMREDCEQFIRANCGDLDATSQDARQHGHDFWLTRNGHGAGFWDRGYGPAGDRLTAAAEVWGSVDLYVTDDGKVAA